MPRARKEHKCDFCHKIIWSGSDYHLHKGTPWDHPDNDSFFTLKVHKDCWDLWIEHQQDWDQLFPLGEPDMILQMLEENYEMAAK